jgi:hypothetical protein
MQRPDCLAAEKVAYELPRKIKMMEKTMRYSQARGGMTWKSRARHLFLEILVFWHVS